MANPGDIFGSRWRVLDRLGRGGQGVVYKAIDAKGLPSESEEIIALNEGLRGIQSEIHQMHPDIEQFKPLVTAIRAITRPASSKLVAVKELLPFDDSVSADERTAIARMKVEIATLQGTKHPALLKVFDSNIDKRWFAMEYFPSGPMSRRPSRYKGNPLAALRALRPVVEVVGLLHEKGIVHRDIKPDNIFSAKGGRLVLGDCGLAFKLENQDRLTLSFENVGTRDYQPPWTYGLRVQDVKPNFDVFSLAKVLWSMISGRPRFPLEDFDQSPHDLREMFPDNAGVLFVHRIFHRCIVRREKHCAIHNAKELLAEIDNAIRALGAGAEFPTNDQKMRCRFCGLGFYKESNNFEATGESVAGRNNKFFVCDHCGHLEVFAFVRGNTPRAWNES